MVVVGVDRLFLQIRLTPKESWTALRCGMNISLRVHAVDEPSDFDNESPEEYDERITSDRALDGWLIVGARRREVL